MQRSWVWKSTDVCWDFMGTASGFATVCPEGLRNELGWMRIEVRERTGKHCPLSVCPLPTEQTTHTVLMWQTFTGEHTGKGVLRFTFTEYLLKQYNNIALTLPDNSK